MRAAADSVVKVEVRDCQGRGSGSGWIAGDAIVMTNAHVVEGTTRVTVRVEGTGPPYPAQPIHYDRLADIAILRVPEARGERALPIDATPRSFSRVAVLGFPFGHRYKARAARLVSVVGFRRRTPDGSGRHPPSFVRSGLGLGPGVSGGPVVDRAGRVVAMIYAGWASDRRRNHLAVASPAMRPALQRARSSSGTVDTGECHED